MSISESKPAFVQRFDGILSKMRWTHIGQAICLALLIATSGFALLAAIDYWYEVGLNDRAIGLGSLGVVTFALAITWIARAIRRWSRQTGCHSIRRIGCDQGPDPFRHLSGQR